MSFLSPRKWITPFLSCSVGLTGAIFLPPLLSDPDVVKAFKGNDVSTYLTNLNEEVWTKLSELQPYLKRAFGFLDKFSKGDPTKIKSNLESSISKEATLSERYQTLIDETTELISALQREISLSRKQLRAGVALKILKVAVESLKVINSRLEYRSNFAVPIPQDPYINSSPVRKKSSATIRSTYIDIESTEADIEALGSLLLDLKSMKEEINEDVLDPPELKGIGLIERTHNLVLDSATTGIRFQKLLLRNSASSVSEITSSLTDKIVEVFQAVSEYWSKSF
ncbi:hypothetical protein MHLP_03220 [Candidatus Mycoplasma haematolamae str. Purdue]|uniref:Uncharacterized protein n=1 Tax=Mycoplasma haematolamae (strain Purdue) TaxID=1212765 RepID=I7CK18_MYCHA|nr:hypothetical protein [Candidatus Mycoplasma haematolamae]AFO52224.1 hypothetical protein MHLP_03220 [Candidatus Mycoplasma haematolamae str. Purdue]